MRLVNALILATCTYFSTATVQNRWELWKNEYSVSYASSEHERLAYNVFLENDRLINHHNALNLSYKLGHNQFSTLTNVEFASRFPIIQMRPFQTQSTNILKPATETTVDWVKNGAVTAVKNQEQCGSCWAFSTTGSFEGAFQIATGRLVSFSEQQLVSCDTTDSGCNGGLMDNAFKWIKTNGGLCSETDYPYVSGGGESGKCETNCTLVGTLSGHVDVKSGDEEELKAAVQMTPVSVAIEADKSVFQLYKSGVLTDESCGTNLDHGVLVVGYGTDGTLDYWKVKNSWGKSWGEQGYIRLQRGVNMCGIASQPSYPTGVQALEPTPAPTPAPTHYGDPFDGCLSDEISVQVEGIPGKICTPECLSNGSCPTDVPTDVTAKPECVLTSGLSSYCALVCDPDSKLECGGTAECQSIQDTGLCTYSE